MALDVVDHVLLGMAQRQHERFLKQLHDGELRELREPVGDQDGGQRRPCSHLESAG